jgi:acetoin utilization deacetylase AcuC-like enzyme
VKPITPVFFHDEQLSFMPLYEWAGGERIEHPETPVRAETIWTEILRRPAEFSPREPAPIPKAAIRRIHSADLVSVYVRAAALDEGEMYFPSVFPKLSRQYADPSNLHHSGVYCFDAGTPLSSQTLTAANWAAAAARDAALAVQRPNQPLAYALCRPPGHHASRDQFGGYCYFNNAAIAASILRRKGKVAVLDIDFHHGNGTQAVFWRDPKVLVVSLHGDPKLYYPYVAGYPDEIGAGAGKGFNTNIPLEPGTDGKHYLSVLQSKALRTIREFQPNVLVLSAGFDTYYLDPIGGFSLETADYHEIGAHIARLGVPIAVVQEGGYYASDLGRNVVALLGGLREGAASAR